MRIKINIEKLHVALENVDAVLASECRDKIVQSCCSYGISICYFYKIVLYFESIRLNPYVRSSESV